MKINKKAEKARKKCSPTTHRLNNNKILFSRLLTLTLARGKNDQKANVKSFECEVTLKEVKIL